MTDEVKNGICSSCFIEFSKKQESADANEDEEGNFDTSN
jgi:hypothetical protein